MDFLSILLSPRLFTIQSAGTSKPGVSPEFLPLEAGLNRQQHVPINAPGGHPHLAELLPTWHPA
jgi:hypothetical protein